ncbi:MAG: lysophospholipid acyltransferase family protein [Myxococcota bacterium]
MIRKWPWFAWAFRKAIAGHLRDGLDGIYASGWKQAQAVSAAGPFILAPTHVAYWDTLLMLYVEDLLGADGYALMERANYDRLPFFGWVGAIPVDRNNSRPAIRAAVTRLDRPGRMMVVFPQGRQRPSHLRPLDLQRGIELIARQSQAVVQPLALAYAFHESPRPTVYLDFPPAMEVGRDARGFLSRLEEELVAGLERIDRWVDEGSGAFDTLVARSTMVRPGLGMRILGWAARWGSRGST